MLGQPIEEIEARKQAPLLARRLGTLIQTDPASLCRPTVPPCGAFELGLEKLGIAAELRTTGPGAACEPDLAERSIAAERRPAEIGDATDLRATEPGIAVDFAPSNTASPLNVACSKFAWPRQGRPVAGSVSAVSSSFNSSSVKGVQRRSMSAAGR